MKEDNFQSNLQSNAACTSTDQGKLPHLDVADDMNNMFNQDYHDDSYEVDHFSSDPEDFYDDETIDVDDDFHIPIQLVNNPDFTTFIALSSQLNQSSAVASEPLTTELPDKILHYDFRANAHHFNDDYI